MKALKDKRILILLIPFFAVLLLYLLRQPDPHFGDSEDFQAWAREDIQGWLGKNYVSLDDWESFVPALQSVEIQGAEHLNDAQQTAYWDSVVDFLQAHRAGTREAWSRFRFNGDQPRTRSTNGVYHVKFYHRLIDHADRELEIHSYLPNLAEFSNVWRENWGKPPTVKPPQTDPDYEELFFQFLQEISPSNYFKGYFQAVCLDEMKAECTVHREAPAPLNQYPFFEHRAYRGHAMDGTFPNIGYSPFDNSGRFTFFHVSPKLEDVLQRDGQIVCMNTFLYVRLDEAGGAAPFLLRHFWDPAQKRWMVTALIDAHLMPHRIYETIF